MYKPCRVRKRKGGLPTNELEQVNATLSEYDQRMLLHVTTNKEDTKNDEGLDFLVSAHKSKKMCVIYGLYDNKWYLNINNVRHIQA